MRAKFKLCFYFKIPVQLYVEMNRRYKSKFNTPVPVSRVIVIPSQFIIRGAIWTDPVEKVQKIDMICHEEKIRHTTKQITLWTSSYSKHQVSVTLGKQKRLPRRLLQVIFSLDSTALNFKKSAND